MLVMKLSHDPSSRLVRNVWKSQRGDGGLGGKEWVVLMGPHQGSYRVEGGVANEGVGFGCLVEGTEGGDGAFGGSVQGCTGSHNLFRHGVNGDGELLFHLSYPVLDRFGSGLGRMVGADGAGEVVDHGGAMADELGKGGGNFPGFGG